MKSRMSEKKQEIESGLETFALEINHKKNRIKEDIYSTRATELDAHKKAVDIHSKVNY